MADLILQNQTQINTDLGFFQPTTGGLGANLHVLGVEDINARPILSTLTVAVSGGTIQPGGGIGMKGRPNEILLGGAAVSTLSVEDAAGNLQIVGMGNLFITRNSTGDGCGSMIQSTNGVSVNAFSTNITGVLSTANINLSSLNGFPYGGNLFVQGSAGAINVSVPGPNLIVLPTPYRDLNYGVIATPLYQGNAGSPPTFPGPPNVWVSTLSRSTFEIRCNTTQVPKLNWMTAGLLS
jgi:hypothetical protein